MVKEPRPGRVKTRLAASVGTTRAAWWFRHQSARILRDLDSPQWRLVLSVSPDHEGLTSRVWSAHLPRMPQGQGDLGARMARVFQTLPPGPAIIIGADIPGITKAQIRASFAELGSHDAVFGPASDGGYWLVGLKRSRLAPKSLFKGVRWSTRDALSDTLGTMPGHTFSLTATLDDVDDATDLARLSPRQRHSI
ncbi:MAG TPA: glycosyltransferase [Aliiroseovarius sp.]|nr:glycosyltransferase [Aliiroseovarius sp.]